MNKDAKITIVLVAIVPFIWCVTRACAADPSKTDWRLCMQAYTFNRFTFYEAIDKTKALGLRYIEAYPGQQLSKEKPDVNFDHNVSAEIRTEVKKKLQAAGVKLVNYGVVGLSNNEQENRKVFDFAKDMGIETIVSEPPEDAFELIDKLCQEYKINVAIHNHPKPSHYWDPNTVLKVCKGRSSRIGACADTGHWFRSGLVPLECLKKLQGRIISLHFKDLSEGHDVVWGTGKCDVKAMLTELARQNFKGVFSIEYEYNWENSSPEIAQCIPYFQKTASQLKRTTAQPEQTATESGQVGWQSIFNGKDLTGWDGDSRFWSAKDGAIRGETSIGNIPSNNTFCIWRGGKLKDFELKVKFRIQNGNSGIQYRSKDLGEWHVGGYQAEVENSPGKVGFLYDERGRAGLANVGEFVVIDENGKKNVISKVSDKDELIKAGYYKEKDWNEYYIIAQGNHIVQYLNGYQTIELIDNDPKGGSREGIFALQIHVGPPMVVEFKDISIKHLQQKVGDAVLLFNGKDLNDWEVAGDKTKSKWVVGTAAVSPDNPKQLVANKGEGEMINLAAQHGDSLDIFSKARFGDCRIELQLMVPKDSNSGVYVSGEYEIQVLDSYGREKMGNGDMGAVYGAAPPPVNACKKPGEWQKYVIEVIAPKFDASGKKVANAKLVKVELNGQVLHENLELPGPTPGGVTGREAPTGPLMFQGNHGPVAYRNIIVKPKLL
jgi:sugar phosphate isomerase/epimerase